MLLQVDFPHSVRCKFDVLHCILCDSERCKIGLKYHILGKQSFLFFVSTFSFNSSQEW